MQYIIDTHTLIWRLLESKRLSPKIKNIFLNKENKFLIPTICLLESQYLKEIGRIDLDMDKALSTIQEEDSFELVAYDDRVMLQSLGLTSTRDPFDRIILAHALSSSNKIITKDKWMKKTAPHLVVW